MWMVILFLEVIQERGDALQSGFALALDFHLEVNLGLADAAQVGDIVQLGDEAHAAAGNNRLAKAHLVHTVVDLHLQVVYLNDLVPQVGNQRHGQVTVGDGAVIGAFSLGTLHVHMDPLVVKRGIGKHVDTVLVNGEPLTGTEFLAQMCGKFFVRVDDKHCIVILVYGLKFTVYSLKMVFP